MAAFMIGKSLKARRQNEAIGKLFDEAGMEFSYLQTHCSIFLTENSGYPQKMSPFMEDFATRAFIALTADSAKPLLCAYLGVE